MLLRCPASGMTVSSAPGTSAAIVRASATVVSRSCSPTTKCVGTAIAARLPTVSWLTVASSDLRYDALRSAAMLSKSCWRAAGAVMVEDAPEVAGEIVERERPGVIVARAVAPRIPRRRREVSGEHTELIAPVRAVSADTVQEDHERAVTGAIDGQAGRRADQIERHGRTTRSVLAGSKRPVRASDHSTRQAPRVASSQ